MSAPLVHRGEIRAQVNRPRALGVFWGLKRAGRTWWGECRWCGGAEAAVRAAAARIYRRSRHVLAGAVGALRALGVWWGLGRVAHGGRLWDRQDGTTQRIIAARGMANRPKNLAIWPWCACRGRR